MRPILPGTDFVTGAFVPAAHDLKAIDTRNRERTSEMIVPTVRGVAWGNAYGTFQDLNARRYGVSIFFRTQPVHGLPMRPKLDRYNKQVQNPLAATKAPGYTTAIPFNSTLLSRMVDRNYYGTPIAGVT